MAALDFPASPSVNDTYTVGSKTWVWNGTSWVNNSSGYTGSFGFTGSQGDRGGARYAFSTTITAADPGAATLRYDNATIASVTNIYIDDLDAAANDLSAWFASFDDSTNASIKGQIIIRSNDNSVTTYNVFEVSGAVTDNTGWFTIPVTYVSGSLPADTEELTVEFIRAGDLGYTGSQGVIGFTGSQGAQGPIGFTGSQGVTGFTGSQGAQGPIGFTGSQGDVGPTGPQGPIGFTGSQGPIGFTGSQGDVGPQGPIGFTGSQGAQGPIGFTGSEGISAGYSYTFSTSTTNADPGAGFFRFDNVTYNSVTEVYLDNAVTEGVVVSQAIRDLNDGDELIFKSIDGSGIVLIYNVTGAATVNAGYVTVPITYDDGSASVFSNNERVSMSVGYKGTIGYTGSHGAQGPIGFTGSQGAQGPIGFTGSQGAQGPIGFTGSEGISSGVTYNFSTILAVSNPGSGSVKYNSSTMASVSVISISETDAASVGQDSWLGTLVTGSQIYFNSIDNPGQVMTFNVTGSITDQGTWRSIPVSYIDGSTTQWSSSERLSVSLFKVGFTGSQGAQGPIGFTGSQGDAGPQGPIGFTGSQGDAGPQGPIGFTGSQGNTGPQGTTGFTGSQGATGPQGPIGYTGSAASNALTTNTTQSTTTTMTKTLTNTSMRVLALGVGTGTFGPNGSIRATNDVTAFYSSDSRFKENVGPIPSPTEKIMQLRGVEFDWTDDWINSQGGEDGYFIRKHDIGVIAQEIEKVLPEVVGTREDGSKAVKYDRIVALLIESNKELLHRVKALESIINNIRGK